jgi:TonB family protein
MRQIALGFFLAGLALHAQPDLLTQAQGIIERCAPQYTPEAKRASIEGTVVLYIQVYPDGTAHNIKVQSSLGSGLDEKAIEAVKQWRFSPGTKYGKPLIVPATIEVKFRLNDTSEPCRAGPPQTEPKPQNGRA